MYVKLNSIFDRESTVYYVANVLMQSITIKTMCTNYILEFTSTKLQFYLSAWVKIEIVIENILVHIVKCNVVEFLATFKI